MGTKAQVIAVNGSFTGSVSEIRCASGSGPAGASTGVTILDRCSFGEFHNDHTGTTGSKTPYHEYTGEIVIEPGNPLKGPISSFHIKNTTGTSPAIVYFT